LIPPLTTSPDCEALAAKNRRWDRPRRMAHAPFRFNTEAGGDVMTDLTQREIEVMILAGDRLSDAEIAHRLSISPRTVATHMRRAFDKLDVRDRLRAAEQVRIRYGRSGIPIPEAPLPAASLNVSDVRSGDAPAGVVSEWFARLPPPPKGLTRLAISLAVMVVAAILFAGVVAVMSISSQQTAAFAPRNGR